MSVCRDFEALGVPHTVLAIQSVESHDVMVIRVLVAQAEGRFATPNSLLSTASLHTSCPAGLGERFASPSLILSEEYY